MRRIWRAASGDETRLLSDRVGFAKVVRGELHLGSGALARLLQERLGKAERDVAGVRRRGALRGLDRWNSKEHRRQELQDPLHAAKEGEHLERGQYSPSEGARPPEADATGGPEGVCSPARVPVRHLLLRAEDGAAPRTVSKYLQEKETGV